MRTIFPVAKEAVDLFLQSQITLSEIETNGIKIDVPYLKSIMQKVQSDITRLEHGMLQSKEYAVWRRMFGGKTKLTSRQQLASVLFGNLTKEEKGSGGRRKSVNISKRGNLGYECAFWSDKGNPEITEESLAEIDLPFVRDYVEYMSLQNVLGTSLKGIADEVDSNGFLHPSFNLNTVQTYRSSCIAKGTMILVGCDQNPAEVPIEDVMVGDHVICFDYHLRPTLRKVLWAGKTGHKKVVRVYFTLAGNGRSRWLDLTPEHRIRMWTGDYIEARNIKCGDSILAFDGGVPVDRVEELPETIDVYDLKVDEFPNFIANGICVHNSSNPNFQNLPARNERMAGIVRRCFIARGADRHFVDLDYSGAEVRCVAEGTKIATIDGDQPIEDVVRRIQNNEQVYVYSWNADKNRIAVHQAVNGWQTGQKRDVWEVVLDSGEVVKATGDHLFMLRDGTYRRLDELKSGDSLMPLYRNLSKVNKSSPTPYLKVFTNSGGYLLAHRMIAEDVLGIPAKNSGLLVHHIDSNGLNNSLSNLKPLTRAEHFSIHSKQGWKNKPVEIRNMAPYRTEEYRKKLQQKMKDRNNEWTEEQWTDLKERQKQGRIAAGYTARGKQNSMYGKKHSEESLLRLSESAKKVWALRKSKMPPKKTEICVLCGKEVSRRFDRHVRKHGLKIKEYREKYNHKVVEIHPAGKADVYDIEVETVHNFALAAGVIVHNCAAAYHRDPVMLRYLSDKSSDMHRDMAAQCYKLPAAKVTKAIRNIAKGNFVFAAFYGASWKSIADALWRLPHVQEVKLDDGTPLSEHLKSAGLGSLGFIDANGQPESGTFYEHIRDVEHDFWNNRFAVYGKWKRDTWHQYLQDGYIDYLSGFRCAGVFPRNEVLNMPIQGLSFHCLLWSMNQINKGIKKYKWKTVLIGQIHDSIEADVPHDELDMFLEFAKHVMTVRLHKHWKFLSAQMEIEAEVAGLGESWFDKKTFEIGE